RDQQTGAHMDAHDCDKGGKKCKVSQRGVKSTGYQTKKDRDRKRKLQVVIAVTEYTPMTLDAATFARIRDTHDWPQEVVGIAPPTSPISFPASFSLPTHSDAVSVSVFDRKRTTH